MSNVPRIDISIHIFKDAKSIAPRVRFCACAVAE
jgi:hypothetical protein